MKRLALLFFLLLGCDNKLTPPSDAIRIPISDQYRAWWREMESCSGVTRNIEEVRFYFLPYLDRDRGLGGLTHWNGPWVAEIFIDPAYQPLGNYEMLVKHEMMHALLRQKGHPDHYFKGVCGNLM